MWIIVTCISRNHCLATLLAWEQSCACWKHAVWNKDWKKQNQTGIVCLVIFSPILPTRLIQRSLFRDWTYLVLNVQNQHHTGVRRPEARLIAHPGKKNCFTQRAQLIPDPAMYSGYRKTSPCLALCTLPWLWELTAFVEEPCKMTHNSWSHCLVSISSQIW